MDDQYIIQATKNWVNDFVINLNLCPFAKTEIMRERVRFYVSKAHNEVQLLEALATELHFLNANPNTETSLLIHPDVLQSFEQYNAFLALCDSLIEAMNLLGIYQVASFHPDYQFANTEPDDCENFTNRSPFPMLHLLREHSLELAIKKHPNVDTIPQKNIDTLNHLGSEHCAKRLKQCFNDEN